MCDIENPEVRERVDAEMRALEKKLDIIGDVEINDYLILEGINKWIEIMVFNARDMEEEIARKERDCIEVSDSNKAELEYFYRSIKKWRVFVAMILKGSSQERAYRDCAEVVSGKRPSYKDVSDDKVAINV